MARAKTRWRQGDPAARAETAPTRPSDNGRADLIAMLSHELRTPLTSIKGFAQLLQRDRSLPESSERFVSIILAEANRAIRTIGDAADLARVQCDRNELHLCDFEVRPLIESAVAELQYHDPEGRIRLNIQEPSPMVRADPSKVERVMVHLISSTLRYSQDAAPIEVGATGDATGVEFWVRDQGQGIPPEKFAHIFDLETEGGEADIPYTSSGLGLYISKHLVEAHGGRLWVESVEGRGSRFAFRLER